MWVVKIIVCKVHANLKKAILWGWHDLCMWRKVTQIVSQVTKIVTFWLDYSHITSYPGHMVIISCRYISSVNVGGYTVHNFQFKAFNLTEFIDNLVPMSRIKGEIVKVAGLLVPDVSILEYLPRVFPAGKPVDGVAFAKNLYLLGATVHGGGLADVVSTFLVFSIDAVYTEYAPRQGVTYLPEYAEPSSGYDRVFEVDNYALLIPETGLSGGIALIEALYNHHDSTDYSAYNMHLLWTWSGCQPGQYHFLSNLDAYSYLLSSVYNERYYAPNINYSGNDGGTGWVYPYETIYSGSSDVWGVELFLPVSSTPPLIRYTQPATVGGAGRPRNRSKLFPLANKLLGSVSAPGISLSTPSGDLLWTDDDEEVTT